MSAKSISLISKPDVEVFARAYKVSISASVTSKVAYTPKAFSISFLDINPSNPAASARSFAVSTNPKVRTGSTTPKFANVLFIAAAELTSAPKLSSVVKSFAPDSAS